MTIGAGSYLEVTIPWVTKSDGYVTKISGQLLHVEASTSLQVFGIITLDIFLQFQKFHVSCQQLKYSIICLVSKSFRSRNFKVLCYDALPNRLEFASKLEFESNCNKSHTAHHLRAPIFLPR